MTALYSLLTYSHIADHKALGSAMRDRAEVWVSRHISVVGLAKGGCQRRSWTVSFFAAGERTSKGKRLRVDTHFDVSCPLAALARAV